MNHPHPFKTSSVATLITRQVGQFSIVSLGQFSKAPTCITQLQNISPANVALDNYARVHVDCFPPLFRQWTHLGYKLVNAPRTMCVIER
jgi:hypothetical protein